MRVVPKPTANRIQFFEGRIAPWTEHSAAIGTDAAMVADLQTKTQAARAAYRAQQAAQQAARSATASLHNAVAAMGVAGAAIILQIRAKAETTGDEGVYALAYISPPAKRSPAGAPGTPDGFTVRLLAAGALELRWKCDNPPGTTGTIYQVYRRIGASGEFAYLGSAGKKRYIDAAIPAGASSITYQIQAVRSTAVGKWAQFNVNFGTGSGAAATSFTPAGSAKAAA